MRIQLWDRHRDRIGGGTMPMVGLYNALMKLGHDVWLVDGFHPELDKYEFIDWWGFQAFGGQKREDVDLMIYSCYWEQELEPWGKQNWMYCLYPKPNWDTSKYNRILTVSEYSADAISEMWNREAIVHIGGVYADDWAIPRGKQAKKNAILSNARFFRESNGHSKNQLQLIHAFSALEDAEDWELWLAGSCLNEGDYKYFRECESVANHDPRIKFFLNLSKEELRELYWQARIFWHAMGYGRENPAETEHYGYVYLKARLARLWVISHASGNRRLSHYSWTNQAQLNRWTRRTINKIREHPDVLMPGPFDRGLYFDDYVKSVERLLSYYGGV